jgi:hypothetical protein
MRRGGVVGAAIKHYERACVIDPHDSSISEALKFAKAKASEVGYFVAGFLFSRCPAIDVVVRIF